MDPIDVGIHSDGRLKFRDRLVQLPLLAEGLPRLPWIPKSAGLSRRAVRYSAIASADFPCSRQGASEVEVIPAIVGLEPDGLAVFIDRLVQLPLAAEDLGEVVVGPVDPRLELDGHAIFVDRFCRLPLLEQGVGEVGPGHRAGRPDQPRPPSRTARPPPGAAMSCWGPVPSLTTTLSMRLTKNSSGLSRQARRRTGWPAPRRGCCRAAAPSSIRLGHGWVSSPLASSASLRGAAIVAGPRLPIVARTVPRGGRIDRRAASTSRWHWGSICPATLRAGPWHAGPPACRPRVPSPGHRCPASAPSIRQNASSAEPSDRRGIAGQPPSGPAIHVDAEIAERRRKVRVGLVEFGVDAHAAVDRLEPRQQLAVATQLVGLRLGLGALLLQAAQEAPGPCRTPPRRARRRPADPPHAAPPRSPRPGGPSCQSAPPTLPHRTLASSSASDTTRSTAARRAALSC